MLPIFRVEQFIEAWNRADLDAVISHLHDDIYYHNLPLQPVSGISLVRDYLSRAFDFDECQWSLLNIAVQGNTVLTERIDAFRYGDAWVRLPVMGTFVIADDRIQFWRDYFDLADYRAQQLSARS